MTVLNCPQSLERRKMRERNASAPSVELAGPSRRHVFSEKSGSSIAGWHVQSAAVLSLSHWTAGRCEQADKSALYFTTSHCSLVIPINSFRNLLCLSSWQVDRSSQLSVRMRDLRMEEGLQAGSDRTQPSSHDLTLSQCWRQSRHLLSVSTPRWQVRNFGHSETSSPILCRCCSRQAEPTNVMVVEFCLYLLRF